MYTFRALSHGVKLAAAMLMSVGLLHAQAVFAPFSYTGDCTVSARSEVETFGYATGDWSWGDGSLSRAASTTLATHSYAAEGFYTVTLTVAAGTANEQQFETIVQIVSPSGVCPAVPGLPEPPPPPVTPPPTPPPPPPVTPPPTPPPAPPTTPPPTLPPPTEPPSTPPPPTTPTPPPTPPVTTPPPAPIVTPPPTTPVPTPQPACVSPATQVVNVSHTGATATVAVAALIAGCDWTASSNREWAQVFPLSAKGTGILKVTMFPNFTSVPRTATLLVSGLPITVHQAANPGTRNQRFVELLYFSFLGRLPSVQEREFQVSQGLRPPNTYADLAINFFSSGEFTLSGRFIAGLYVGLLQRDAEYGGWLFQRTALAAKAVDHHSLVRNFVSSTEFVMKFGILSDADFVRLLYRSVLQRPASQQEIDFQVAAIRKSNAEGKNGQAVFGANLLASDEFAQNSGARLTAFLLYATLLQHDIPETLRGGRIMQLSSGITPKTIIQELLANPEFAAVID